MLQQTMSDPESEYSEAEKNPRGMLLGESPIKGDNYGSDSESFENDMESPVELTSKGADTSVGVRVHARYNPFPTLGT